jgi:hypothetical protein
VCRIGHVFGLRHKQYIHVCMHTCIYTYIHTYIHTYTHSTRQPYTKKKHAKPSCTGTSPLYASVYVCMYAYTYTYMHAHYKQYSPTIHTKETCEAVVHTHTHTYIHTHTVLANHTQRRNMRSGRARAPHRGRTRHMHQLRNRIILFSRPRRNGQMLESTHQKTAIPAHAYRRHLRQTDTRREPEYFFGIRNVSGSESVRASVRRYHQGARFHTQM